MTLDRVGWSGPSPGTSSFSSLTKANPGFFWNGRVNAVTFPEGHAGQTRFMPQSVAKKDTATMAKAPMILISRRKESALPVCVRRSSYPKRSRKKTSVFVSAQGFGVGDAIPVLADALVTPSLELEPPCRDVRTFKHLGRNDVLVGTGHARLDPGCEDETER